MLGEFGGGTASNNISSVQTPDPYFGAKPIDTRLPPMDSNPFFGNTMQATPTGTPGPSLTQTATPYNLNNGRPGGLNPALLTGKLPGNDILQAAADSNLGGAGAYNSGFKVKPAIFSGDVNNNFNFRQEGDMGRYVADNDPGQQFAGYSSYQDYIGAGNDPVERRPLGQQTLQAASSKENLKRALPGLFAKGGRAGFYTGGITDVEPSLDDIGHGSDAMMSRTRLV